MKRPTRFRQLRDQMVKRQLRRRDITDERVLAAMAEVPREAFVPEHLADHAYDDAALPIDCGQTISQPYIVALMAQALSLQSGDRVLEVGCGSGYAAAVMARCCRQVYTIERHPALAEAAAERLARLGFRNVHVVVADGTEGHVDEAPYDAISVPAQAAAVPAALVDQLAPSGRLVMPVGSAGGQDLQVLRRTTIGLERSSICGVRFVPLTRGMPT